jgi:hypothetical protein
MSSGARPYQVSSQAGASWGEVYMLVPASAGERFDVAVVGTHQERLGGFSVDTLSLACSF